MEAAALRAERAINLLTLGNWYHFDMCVPFEVCLQMTAPLALWKSGSDVGRKRYLNLLSAFLQNV